MAYTVAAAFDAFYENINLSGDHRQTANARRDNVVDTLSKKFEIVESFATGSIPKFTALKGQADLDVMVALHYGKHIKDKTPTQVLQDVRAALAEWRTGAGGVRIFVCEAYHDDKESVCRANERRPARPQKRLS
jgi:tRNA nucleotidyltransferase (CCA-adding enzyme)